VLARVTFVRKVETTRGSEIVLADYNVKRELPFNQPVNSNSPARWTCCAIKFLFSRSGSLSNLLEFKNGKRDITCIRQCRKGELIRSAA
jgi:hypothetical protein